MCTHWRKGAFECSLICQKSRAPAVHGYGWYMVVFIACWILILKWHDAVSRWYAMIRLSHAIGWISWNEGCLSLAKPFLKQMQHLNVNVGSLTLPKRTGEGTTPDPIACYICELFFPQKRDLGDAAFGAARFFGLRCRLGQLFSLWLGLLCRRPMWWAFKTRWPWRRCPFS